MIMLKSPWHDLISRLAGIYSGTPFLHATCPRGRAGRMQGQAGFKIK
jgi:hypothetical protein